MSEKKYIAPGQTDRLKRPGIKDVDDKLGALIIKYAEEAKNKNDGWEIAIFKVFILKRIIKEERNILANVNGDSYVDPKIVFARIPIVKHDNSCVQAWRELEQELASL